MNFTEFEQEFLDCLDAIKEDGSEICVAKYNKNNGLILTGVTYKKEGLSIAPTYYLEHFYSAYLEGESVEALACRMLSGFNDAYVSTMPDLDFFDDYSELRKRIVCKLINRELNKEMLENVPHIDICDLSVIFYVIVELEGQGKGSIVITNNIIDDLDVTAEDMYRDAIANTWSELGCVVKGIDDVLLEMLLARESSDIEDEKMIEEIRKAKDNGISNRMFVMSNRYKFNGAICMLNRSALRELSNRIRADIYILPSSIHELILLPATGDENIDELKDMVLEVNGTQVELQERLSDNVYVYERESGEIKIA